MKESILADMLEAAMVDAILGDGLITVSGATFALAAAVGTTPLAASVSLAGGGSGAGVAGGGGGLAAALFLAIAFVLVVVSGELGATSGAELAGVVVVVLLLLSCDVEGVTRAEDLSTGAGVVVGLTGVILAFGVVVVAWGLGSAVTLEEFAGGVGFGKAGGVKSGSITQNA